MNENCEKRTESLEDKVKNKLSILTSLLGFINDCDKEMIKIFEPRLKSDLDGLILLAKNNSNILLENKIELITPLTDLIKGIISGDINPKDTKKETDYYKNLIEEIILLSK